MVFNKQISKLGPLLILLALSMIGGCASSDRADREEEDIYASFRDGRIQYRSDDNKSDDIYAALRGDRRGASSMAVEEQINEIRTLFIRQQYDQAANAAEQLLRQNPYQAEAYYWLARIHLNQSDFQQADNLAERGLGVVDNPSLRRELERVQTQAKMGEF